MFFIIEIRFLIGKKKTHTHTLHVILEAEKDKWAHAILEFSGGFKKVWTFLCRLYVCILAGIPSIRKRTEMDAAVCGGYQVLTFSGSSSVLGKSIKYNKTSLGLTKTSGAAKGITSSSRRLSTVLVQAQERPTWLPGLDPPPYLDGT